MRVGLVIYGSLSNLSGGFLYDRKLVEFLRSQGDSVEVVGFPWIDYPRHVMQNFSPTLTRQIQEKKVDLWLQDELNHPSLFWMNRRLRRKIGAPVFSVVHHLRSSEEHPPRALWLYRWIELAYLRSVDAFIFNSLTTQKTVQAMMGAIVPGVIATPAGDRFGAGLRPAEIAQRCRQPGPLRLLFIGNLIRRKRLQDVIAALAQLRGEDWQLDVVGRSDIDPGYARELKAQIRRLGLEGRVILRGNLSEDKLKRTLKESQVLSVVSSYEGFGIVYLEGMSYGLPVIASTAGGAREIVEHKKNGRLVAPGDIAAIADALGAYCRDRKLLAAHSLSARAHSESFPTWEQTAQKIREFMISILQR
jgi:glycosyltransferase involved in cell wall biosynthesis